MKHENVCDCPEHRGKKKKLPDGMRILLVMLAIALAFAAWAFLK